ncbi:xanthine dehydrogenase accessory protein XdhC [Adhaeretor mobilis]|uniref:XdhC and CoxI family protein n=1 Tax=Adhaeretor mobilis TaxID=1930276 RepID=A0A517MQG4_9BACT|nr:xanthine dehydrogenase accessory protein XdhC [Adhaeretor mobilis]QDS97114.1 XdhC and CoxI family protein [Adhaeretor mobilis]
MSDLDFLNCCKELADAGTPYVLVTLIEAIGSTPQDIGARMLVTSGGISAGTVGGGRVEAKAIAEAQAMLDGGVDHLLHDWSLKADVGMTCGGRMRMFFQTFGMPSWQVIIFGAGHVTQALTRQLLHLPSCGVTCIDPRAEWLEQLPAGIATIQTDDPPAEVERLPDDAYVLCMTRGHASDLPVLQRIFQSGRTFPFLGVIGSRAKAAVLRKELAETGIPAEQAQFHCPVGLPIGSNHPGEIAVSIAAQLLEVRGST